jgi:serine/threonine protein kinase
MSRSVVGSRVADYLITAEIGDGASGCVYSATHERTKREVAFKVLRSELASNHVITARFLKEAHTINAIGHPNIVEVLGSGEIDERLMSCSSCCAGRPWRRAWRRPAG